MTFVSRRSYGINPGTAKKSNIDLARVSALHARVSAFAFLSRSLDSLQMVEQSRKSSLFSPMVSPKNLSKVFQPSPPPLLSPHAMTTSEIQAYPPPPPPSHPISSCVAMSHAIHLQAELEELGLSHNIDVQRGWDKQPQLARILEEVRNGTYRPRSPSPPPPIPAPMSASMLRRKASSPPPAAYVNPAPQLQQRSGRVTAARDEDVIAAQDEDVQPSAFARYMNALLFPGLPQLLMRPFVIEDALIGAVLMLVAAIGWLFLVQAYFGTSSAVVTAQSPGDASYAQYWPLLVHVASLLHMLSIKTK